MHEQHDSRGSTAPVVIGVVVLLFLLPVLYVLSIGPAFWLAKHEFLSEGAYWNYCAPLLPLVTKYAFLNDAMNQYLLLWGDPIVSLRGEQFRFIF